VLVIAAIIFYAKLLMSAAPSVPPMLRSREESIYHRLIVESFGEAAKNIVDNAGRWSEGRVGS